MKYWKNKKMKKKMILANGKKNKSKKNILNVKAKELELKIFTCKKKMNKKRNLMIYAKKRNMKLMICAN